MAAAFVQRLHELDWIERRTVVIEFRWTDGHSERFAEIASEFVRLKVDIIVTSGAAALAAKQATSVIPGLHGEGVAFKRAANALHRARIDLEHDLRHPLLQEEVRS
jgi:putative ABC transport system substrate-binding protein